MRMWLKFGLVVIFAILSRCESSILKQVHVIARHGARTSLAKTPYSADEGNAGEAVLTPNGERQMYDLGVWLRERYQNKGIIDVYNSSKNRLESSDYDRTIVSAQSMAMGLFPAETRLEGSLLPDGVTPNNIPVFTRTKTNDIMMRAYDKCPKFHNHLNKLYKSQSWVQKESEHLSFLIKLAQYPRFQQHVQGDKVPLKNLWTVYDAIHVARTECPTNSTLGCPDPELRVLLTDQEWTTLQNLAHYAEINKYSKQTAGSLLGGNILLQIFQRMGGTSLEATTQSIDRELQRQSDSQFFYYSAHYPTILSTFAALGLASPIDEILPDYGSALIVELHSDEASKQDFVKLFFRETESQLLSVLFDGPCFRSLGCSMDNFRQTLLLNLEFTSHLDWCDVCHNGSADICLMGTVYELQKEKQQVSALLDEAEAKTCGTNQSQIVGGFVGGIVLGLLLAGVLVLVFRRYGSKKVEGDGAVMTPGIKTTTDSSGVKEEGVL